MKKLVASLLILSLLGTCAAGAADGAKDIYTSDFSADTDGWYGRGAQSFITPEGTLKTTGRTSSWNSPGRDFNLPAAPKPMRTLPMVPPEKVNGQN